MPDVIPRGEFDAAFYLAQNPDILAAMGRGELQDPYDHYVTHGVAERRPARQRRGRRVRPTRAAEAVPAPEPPQAGRSWRPHAASCPACPVCRAFGPIPPLLAEEGHVLYRCPTCRSCFYGDRTVPDYEREVETGFYQQLYLEQNGSIHHVLGTLFLTDTAGVDSLLDVGCGFGFTVDVAAKTLGWRAVGIDPSHYAREGARVLGADIRKEYLTGATELGEPFGLVVASEVIEHVPDPDAFLLVLRRWLQPGRVLVLTTPDADAIGPEAGEAELVSILAVGTHLILFSAQALELALARAGFAHVEVEARGNTLVALASDSPIVRLADADRRHIEAYQAYLEHLVEAAPAGTPLWNGAAGRLLQLRAESAPLDGLHALFARVAAAWVERFGIDLARLRLPGTTPEREFMEAAGPDGGRALMWRRLEGRPVNLATVLFCRAAMEDRRAGRLPEEVLRWLRPAYVHAVDTVRTLAAGTMIDLDLRQTARRARLRMLDLLAELAPELEPEMLLAARALPEPLRAFAPTVETVAARTGLCFARLVQENRFEEAKALEPLLGGLDTVAGALAHDGHTLMHTLFNMGVLRLVHERNRHAAAQAFERLEAEARRRLPSAEMAGFAEVARVHLAMTG